MQFRSFHVLKWPVLTEIRGMSRYVYKETQKDLVITGIWSWYQGIADPLIILRTWPDGSIIDATTGSYAGTNRTQINVNLPALSEDQIMIQVSQDGDIRPKMNLSSLNLTLIDKPVITKVTPTLLDSKSTDPIWIHLTGRNFFKDAGLGFGIRNLHCMVNNASVDVIFTNESSVACLLQPDVDVKLYEIAVSTNFGDQWVYASDKKLKLVDLPQIAGLYPTRIPSNVVS